MSIDINKNIKKYIKNEKRFLITILITIIISFLITKIPLISGLTYEFSFIINITLLLLYPIAFKFNKKFNIYKAYTLLVVPIIIQLLTIKNLCDPFKGILFYLLIPTTTLFLIHHLLNLLVRVQNLEPHHDISKNLEPHHDNKSESYGSDKSGGTRDGASFSHHCQSSGIPETSKAAMHRLYRKYYFIIFLSLSAELYLLYSEPQIFFYNSFWGYFQGSLYDIGFSISKPLIWLAVFKIINGVILKVMIDITLLEKAKIKKQKIILFSLILLSSLIYFNQNTLGLKANHKHLQETLGGYYKTKNFNIYYSLTPRIKQDIKLIAAEHEMRLAQLEEMFNIKWKTKIDSYIFESSDQKKSLMGAGNTLIAKPWLGEIYINYSSQFPHPHLKHELSHVIAANFNDSFLNIPMKYGIIPQMGIVEGLAVSSEDEMGVLTIFEQMAILKKLKKFPQLEKMVSFEGFWSYNGYFAYKTVGGFLRFLKIKYGIEKIKQLYQNKSFKKTYHKTVLELKSEYLEFLDKIKINERYIPKTQSNFSQRSVFKRVCPHDLQEIKEESNNIINQKGFLKGISHANKLLKLEPKNINHIIYLAQLSMKNERYNKALSYLLIEMHRHASLSATQTYIDRLKADILWVTQKDKKKALNIYKNLIKKNISNSTYRELFIKINALKDENIENLILNYLIKRKALGSYIYHFDKIKLDSKSFSIVNYLYARYYFNKKNYKESIFYLNRIDNNLPNIFNIEILKIKIISNFFLKKHSLSQKYSKDLHDISETYGLKEFSKNWIKINKYFSNKKAIDL